MGKKKKKIWKILFSVLWNKYFISLTGLIVWITFFDKNDFMSQYEMRQKLNQLRSEQQYYIDEIEKSKHDMNELRTHTASLEKFAREKYLMKKDNEEIFVIVKDSAKGVQSTTVSAP